ncbi:MAG: FAD-binding oxidoreductase [Burkholderiales bacterium]|nr:FAD-binding oxidoreductase [Burkholderiales bacterium]
MNLDVGTFYDASAGHQPAFPPLKADADADIVIIGGGFAGLGTALSLLERGQRDTVVLEAQAIGHGASGRNAGFVSGGFSRDPGSLQQKLGHERARELYLMSEAAVQRIRERIARYRIDCDPVFAGVIVASWFNDDASLLELQRVMREGFGLHWEWLPRDQLREMLLTDRYHGGLHEKDAFHFNPLKYAHGLARALHEGGVVIHENSLVANIASNGAGWVVQTPAAKIRCRQVAVCCGAYIGDFCPRLSRASLPVATYVMATEPLGDRLADAMRTRAAVFDTRFAFDYYRPLADTRLLWGGRLSVQPQPSSVIADLLRRDLLRVYPQLSGVRVAHAWSGLMSYTRHRMPQIGQLATGHWHALGFGGHGVAPTTLGGELLARAMLGEAPIPPVFSEFGLTPTFGKLGLAAAQMMYWVMQGRDAVLEWHHSR